jgi:hypothetical protein
LLREILAGLSLDSAAEETAEAIDPQPLFLNGRPLELQFHTDKRNMGRVRLFVPIAQKD